MTHTIEESKARLDEFQALCDPLIKWLNDNANPHSKIIVTTGSAELLSGERAYHSTKFIKD